MTKTLTMLACLVALTAGTANAEEECFVPMSLWQPKEAVTQLAAQNEWTVRRIKIDDGCYQIDGTDAAGRRIEVTIHPATLDVIEIEYEDADEDDD